MNIINEENNKDNTPDNNIDEPVETRINCLKSILN